MNTVDPIELANLVRREAPRDVRAVSDAAPILLKQLTRPWLGPFVVVALMSVVILIPLATAPSLDTFSLVFVAIFAVATVLIAIAIHVGERRKGRNIERLLVDGELLVTAVMNTVHLARGNTGRPSRFIQLWGEATPRGAIVSMTVKLPLAVGTRIEVGTAVFVLVHDDVPFSLWVFPDGFPPALGSPATVTPHERGGAYR